MSLFANEASRKAARIARVASTECMNVMRNMCGEHILACATRRKEWACD